MNQESPDMDLVYDAYDGYAEARKLAEGKNKELEAICLHHLGVLQYVVFKNNEKAKQMYAKCIYEAFGLMEGGAADINEYLGKKDWFNKAQTDLNKIHQALAAADEVDYPQAIKDELKAEFAELQKIRDKGEEGQIEIMKLLITEKYWIKGQDKIEVKESELTTKAK